MRNGYRHDGETIARMKECIRTRWQARRNELLAILKATHCGAKRSAETRDKIRQARLAHWRDPVYRKKMCAIRASDEYRNKMRALRFLQLEKVKNAALR